MRAEEKTLPAYTLAVPEGTPRSSVTTDSLSCPEGCRAIDMGAEAVYCVRWPVPKAAIPQRHGPAVWFHANGAMSMQGSYQDHVREGVWVDWYESGKLKAVATYAKDEYDGLYVTFWENGARQSQIDFQAGKKHGWSTTWGEDGEPMTITRYEQDASVESWVADSAGGFRKIK